MPENDQALLWMRHSPLTDALSGLYALWSVDYTERYGRPQDWIIYDSVAIGMVLWPDLFTTRPAFVKVIDGGFTVIDETKPPNSEIGVTIDKDEFLKRMLKRLIDQNLERP
jgi:inosine-uridine nucleoside N-ribohydrolase